MPAGMRPPVVLVKGASASSACSPLSSRLRMAAYSCTPLSVTEYQSEAAPTPPRTPPTRVFVLVIGVVVGVKLASPRGTSAVSAPQLSEWLQAPGGA